MCVHAPPSREVWLDESTAEEDSSGDWEVIPFPRHQEECDLTSLARDLIRLNAPYEKLCDECGDDDGGGGFVFKLEDDEPPRPRLAL